MNSIQIEIATHIEAVEKTAALLRQEITRQDLTVENVLTIGKYMGSIGRDANAAATLIGLLARQAKDSLQFTPKPTNDAG